MQSQIHVFFIVFTPIKAIISVPDTAALLSGGVRFVLELFFQKNVLLTRYFDIKISTCFNS